MHRSAVLFLAAAASAYAAEYRIDCDSARWKSLNAVNALPLAPGDRVLFKSGCVWKGGLALKGSGKRGAPIVVDRYGPGAMPRIDGGGAVEDAVLIKNQQWIEVRNLEVTNRGAVPALRRGVHIWMDDIGAAEHITVSGMFIHDVNGVHTRKDNGGIIWRTTGRKTPTRFDGLLLESNIIWRVDRSAMAADSAFVDRRKWFPSLNVVIRDNYVEDIGGDGIVPWASDGALVEHNIAKDCNKRGNNYNAGIWPWSCDNTVLRLNEASFTRTLKDGQGFDSDYNSRNTLIEYNYSHDNEGGFLLICTPKHEQPAAMVTNIGVTVRNNISRNDKARTFHLPGPVEKVRVHDNAVYIGKGDTVNLVQISDWKGWPDDVEFANNLFYVAGVARYGHEVKRFENGDFQIAPGWGPAKNVRFTGNTYTGRHENRPHDPQARTEPGRTIANWNGPTFSPERPEQFKPFMQAHREWLMNLMEQQFGKRPN